MFLENYFCDKRKGGGGKGGEDGKKNRKREIVEKEVKGSRILRKTILNDFVLKIKFIRFVWVFHANGRFFEGLKNDVLWKVMENSLVVSVVCFFLFFLCFSHFFFFFFCCFFSYYFFSFFSLFLFIYSFKLFPLFSQCLNFFLLFDILCLNLSFFYALSLPFFVLLLALFVCYCFFLSFIASILCLLFPFLGEGYRNT